MEQFGKTKAFLIFHKTRQITYPYMLYGTPYVAFKMEQWGWASVMNYVNNNWGYVGSPGFTTNSADETCLSFSGGNPI